MLLVSRIGMIGERVFWRMDWGARKVGRNGEDVRTIGS